MGLLDDLMRSAIGDAVKQAVQPKAEEAAAQTLNQAAQTVLPQQNPQAAETQTGQKPPSAEEMQAAFGALGSFLKSAAAHAAEHMKICEKCGEGVPADKSFCPKCGTKMPEMTVAEGVKCRSCGRQNEPGTKFCTGCGEKLPAETAAEQAAAASDAAVLAVWKERLPQFPVWSCGGMEYELEREENPETECWRFGVRLPSAEAAQQAVQQYRALLKQNGFRQEGQYPDDEHLYLRVDGVSCHVDTEHCFEADADSPTIYFDHRQPYGGYDYKKPEQKPQSGGGLFGALFG